MNSLNPRPTGRAALVGWLLPFVGVSAAILAHWYLSVPPGPLPPPVPKDPPKEEPKKPEPKRAPAAANDDEDGGFEPFTTPRSDNLLVQLREAYGELAFKSEPTFEAWSVAHRPLITQIITATRLQVFKGVVPSPSISTSNVECHTIRCRFTLSSNKEEDLQSLLDALASLKLDGAPLWHTWKPEAIAEEPTKRANARPRMRTNVLVSFRRDLPKVDAITLESGAPLKPASVAPIRPAAATPTVPATTKPTTSPTALPSRPSTSPPTSTPPPPTSATAPAGKPPAQAP
jgi:hypothetical protein